MKHSIYGTNPSLLCVPALILILSGCSGEENIQNPALRIDASNAADVAAIALDMAGAADDADDVLDAVAGTGTVNETVNCNDPALDPVTGSGTATVTGTDDQNGKNLTITYNNCSMRGFTLNGTFHILSSTTNNVKSGTVTGNLTVDFNGASFTISGYSLAFTKDTVTNDYTDDFGMTVSSALLLGSSIDVNATVPFAGNKLNTPDNPVSGEMVVTGSGNTKAKVTAVDNTAYTVDADTNGDDVYDTQITNTGNGTLLFPW